MASEHWGSPTPMRYFAGIVEGRRSARVKGVLLQCRGEGWQLRVQHVEGISCPSPTESTQWPTILKQLLASLADRADIPLATIDSVGVGPLTIDDIQTGQLLAEQTGLTTVVRFADRDRALGGRGTPLSCHPDWLLFHHPHRGRILIDVGPSTRISYLEGSSRPEKVICFDAGPGTDFLDLLALSLSDGRLSHDPSGHFAVQGTLSRELVDQWASHPFLLKSPPRTVELSDFDDAFVQASISFARENRLSGKDVLCSANHFLVHAVTKAIERFLPETARQAEVLTSGGGMRSGMLRKLLGEHLEPRPIRSVDDAGVPADVLYAAQVAILSYLTMENLPGNAPAVTGARASRPLGIVIPGSPLHWDRWVCNLADRFELEARRAA